MRSDPLYDVVGAPELRARLASLGWRDVAAMEAAEPLGRAEEHVAKRALESADGLVILSGGHDGEVPATVRDQAIRVLIDRYFPRDRVLLATASIPETRALGLRQVVDAADTFFCRGCDAFASARTCPHDPLLRARLSTAQLRDVLRSGGNLPRELYRPEVAEVLRAHWIAEAGTLAAADVQAPAREGGRGFILWFTGLSGAGKSTLSNALRRELEGLVHFEVLDGDEVRTYLSKGLGFTKEDRDTNVRRIGYVARLLARNGTPVVTAAISPYRDVRDEIRRLAERDGIAFVEVFVNASVDALAARDVKGLYRKALAGELPRFTGVSDPYEPPIRPELVVQTDRDPISVSLGEILDLLRARGLVPAATQRAA